MQKKGEWILTALMRAFLGILGIHFLNLALQSVSVSLGVGVNPVSVLTITILGFPGFVGLYLIGFYRLL